jgi:hypothetical protein
MWIKSRSDQSILKEIISVVVWGQEKVENSWRKNIWADKYFSIFWGKMVTPNDQYISNRTFKNQVLY